MSLKKNENVKVNLNRLEVFVDAKTFSEACEKAYKKECKKIRVPGFRVGKAPKKVIEKFYGKGVFFEDAIDMVYAKALDNAIIEAKLDVVAIEDLKVLSASEDEGLCFSVDCYLKPKIEVKEYKGLEIEKNVRKITEKDVDDRIMALRERAGRVVEVTEKRPAKDGDLVVIDYTGFIDGISFRGGTAKNQNLKLGSKQFIEGFEDQIIGHNVGEEFEIEVVFPENYHAKELQSKKALFKCKLIAIKKVELPKEDDEFAKDVSEFDSLEKLRENIKKEMEDKVSSDSENFFKNRVLNMLVENVVGEIPEVMFENRTKELINEYDRNLKSQGGSLRSYLNFSGIDEEVFNENLKRQAIFEVKLELALERIVELESLKVDEQELQKQKEAIANQYKVDVKNFDRFFSVELLKKDILKRQAVEFVEKNCKVVEKSERDEENNKEVAEKTESKKNSEKGEKVEKSESTETKKSAAEVNSSEKSVKIEKEKSAENKKTTKSKKVTTKSKIVDKEKSVKNVKKSEKDKK